MQTTKLEGRKRKKNVSYCHILDMAMKSVASAHYYIVYLVNISISIFNNRKK